MIDLAALDEIVGGQNLDPKVLPLLFDRIRNHPGLSDQDKVASARSLKRKAGIR